MVAILRSWTEALRSSDSRTNGSRAHTVGSPASSSMVVVAPTRMTAASAVIQCSGRLVTSTSREGDRMPSFSIRST